MKKQYSTNDIYNFIAEKITTGKYPSGYRLVENDIATEFGVSRTPVRLAIEKLVSEGLVRHIPNKGAVVRQMSVDDIRGLYQLREVSEGLAARLAAQRCTDKDIENMNAILKEMDEVLEADNIQQYYVLCGEIHRYIFNMTGNDFIIDFIGRIYTITSRYHVAVLYIPGRSLGSIEEHHKVVEAIATRDGDLAERTMKEHVRKSGSFYNNPEVLSSLQALSRIDWNRS